MRRRCSTAHCCPAAVTAALQRTLEVAVVSYLESHVGEITPLSSGGVSGAAVASTPTPRMTVEEFLDVTAAPGRMDDMRHAEVC